MLSGPSVFLFVLIKCDEHISFKVGHLEYNANTLEHPADTYTQPLPRTLLVSKVRREPGPALSIRYMAAIWSRLPQYVKPSASAEWLFILIEQDKERGRAESRGGDFEATTNLAALIPHQR